MVAVNVLDNKGKVVSNLELKTVEGDMGILHEALKRQLNNARSGSANTKTRAQVRGGGRKPWRQKGTGRARAGSIRSPLWNGGGVIFGPKPRDYSVKMNRKARHLAVSLALSKACDKFLLLDNMDSFKDFSTKAMADLFKTLGLTDKTVLLVLDYENDNAEFILRSARNIEGCKVLNVNYLNVKDLIHFKAIVTTKATMEMIVERYLSQN